MDRQQFRTLYREFLFRMVDLELLSAQGDITKLFGQFASFLVYFSLIISLGALTGNMHTLPLFPYFLITAGIAHFLIATTMLAVGLFAVLAWDSTFPNRRDVMVLAPLPVRPRTVFLAKVAAIGGSLTLTIGSLNAISGVLWPAFALFPLGGGFLSVPRTLLAYWVTVLGAGAFIFCSVLAIQGLTAQLPRRLFLRVSAALQMAVFCLFICAYFLEPSLFHPASIVTKSGQDAMRLLPTYWFLGLFEWLNGSAPPLAHQLMAVLAKRAGIAMALSLFLAGTAFLLSYFRSLRKIAEEPDILPGSRGSIPLPPFGSLRQTAVAQFAIRTLMRSRQHRMILAFYLGVGLAVVAICVKSPSNGPLPGSASLNQSNLLLPVAAILMTCAWIAGARVVFAMPMDVRANWMLRIVPLTGGAEFRAATRRSLLALSVAPACFASAVLLFNQWPWRPAAAHLILLTLTATALAEASLFGFRKFPFACSYLPGRMKIHMVIVCATFMLIMSFEVARDELPALTHFGKFLQLAIPCAAAVAIARFAVARHADANDSSIEFEAFDPPVIQSLGITIDGGPIRPGDIAPPHPAQPKLP